MKGGRLGTRDRISGRVNALERGRERSLLDMRATLAECVEHRLELCHIGRLGPLEQWPQHADTRRCRRRQRADVVLDRRPSAASSTERHSTPTWSRLHASGVTPTVLIRPCVGLKPITPQ